MNFKCLSILVLLCLSLQAGFAAPKSLNNALRLVCDYKKVKGNEYEIVFKLTLKKGLYIKANNDYDSAQQLKMPYFIFDSNEQYNTLGEISSKGLIETKKLKHIGIVNVYSYTVLYNQTVSALPGAVISGVFRYQLCNSKEPKRVKTEKFSVTIK